MSLVDSFPTDKLGFDGLLGQGTGFKYYSYDIKKDNDSQKGTLFGFFIESLYSFSSLGSGNVSLSMSKAIKEDDENPSSGVIKPDTRKSSLSIRWIFFSCNCYMFYLCASKEKKKENVKSLTKWNE